MDIKRVVISALSFVAFYNLLFFQTSFGIGTGVLFLLLNLYFFINRGKEIKNLGWGISSSVLSTVFGFLIGFRANETVLLINLLTALFFSLTAFYFYRSLDLFNLQIPSFLLIPINVLIKTSYSFKNLFNSEQKLESSLSKNARTHIFRGFLIAVPLLFVLTFLLFNADPVFAKVLNDLSKNLGGRLAISLIIFIALFLVGIIKFIQKREAENVLHIEEEKAYEFLVILVGIVSLLGLFIFIQVKYLFSKVGELELHQLGISSLTYSEYVRKGFFELLMASAIAALVIIYILKLLHSLKGSRKSFVQLFSILLTGEIGLLLLSAAQRLNLYATTHGLTRARIFGFIFLVWLVSILVILAFRIFREYKKGIVFKTTLATIILALVSINAVNIDGLIATKYKPTVNGEIDYFYISEISADAYQGWMVAIAEQGHIVDFLKQDSSLSEDDNRKLIWAKITLERVNEQKNYLENKYSKKKWQSFNFSEFLAYTEVAKNKQAFDRMTNILSDIAGIESKVSLEVKNNTSLDRSLDPPF
ncbi:DUF4173 domain-containing protein [Candidatus Daviesbacteria bacterium]|nr:DUF4173 domain-containing protein [Candidatus Daviesbacteria bacterium]